MHWLDQRNDCFLDELIFRHVLRVIFIIDWLAKIGDQLLLQQVGLFSALHYAISEHVCRYRYTQLFPKLNYPRDICFALLLKALLDKVVVVIETNIDPMRITLSLVKGRDNLDLGRRIFFRVPVSLLHYKSLALLSCWFLKVFARLRNTFLRQRSRRFDSSAACCNISLIKISGWNEVLQGWACSGRISRFDLTFTFISCDFAVHCRVVSHSDNLLGINRIYSGNFSSFQVHLFLLALSILELCQSRVELIWWIVACLWHECLSEMIWVINIIQCAVENQDVNWSHSNVSRVQRVQDVFLLLCCLHHSSLLLDL